MAIAGFVTFDVLGIIFLVWCLANFIREGRRYKSTRVNIMRIDPMLPHKVTTRVVAPRESEQLGGLAVRTFNVAARARRG